MSTQSQLLEIAPLEASLPKCTPNLMPFHIAYSGPAPVSTYLRVRPAPAFVFGQEDNHTSKYFGTASETATGSATASSSRSTLVATSTSVTLDTDPTSTQETQSSLEELSSKITRETEDGTIEETQSTLVATTSTVTLATETITADASQSDSASKSSSASAERWAASFRGRAMQGLTISLPEGYAGIVLRAPEDGTAEVAAARKAQDRAREREKAKARAQKAGRKGTRRSARVESDVEDEDMDDCGNGEEQNGMVDGTYPEEPVRTLTATSTFSQFVLWNPDFPVDEGKDEYLRSLTEWTRLAAEIHRVDL
ncbi:hypothetical protein CERSUDRAFT_93010 [Gelatoporia subvermispora B]|uniref:Uncharacterized protein n=1 Tax=Ceriporiopsis subvermispora (strain B) TaxID=914234 RepID=M2R373_CERS8|nr:hypothetical protein CERSUDRAFT_93010 [Gelatoporia subvermispora B]